MAEETGKTPETHPEADAAETANGEPTPADGAEAPEATAETPDEPPEAALTEAEEANPWAGHDESAAEPGAEVPTSANVRIAELEAEAAELKDKLLRALAEAENVRRRAARDRQDASKYAIAGLAREMLMVADNLRRALDSVDAEARAANEAVESLVAGVEMTERAMLAAFERFAIKPIEALGQKFDHNFHEAMFELDDPTQPAGTVVQELEKGYMLDDRLLRPSRVGVSKGGPAANGNGESAGKDGDGETEATASDGPGTKDKQAAYEKRADSESPTAGPAGAKVDKKL